MISKSLKYSALLAVSLGAAALAGCGSSNKGGSASLDSVALVDEASCRTCHANTLEPLTGDSIITQFNNSPHVANGCQSCHGGGSLHNGVGPMPYAKPGPEQCATCHEDNDSTEYATSGHATVDTEGGEAKCNRCHTHEGAVLGMKNGFTGDKTVMDAMVNAPQAIANASTIQCATCHVMHEGTLRTDSTWDPALKVGAAVGGGSDEYNLCTGCHTYINEAGQLVASGNNGTAQFYHNTAWNRTIASTHYDNPATNTTNGKLVEGYVLRTDKANPCFDCHGHEAKTNTNILSRNSSGQYVRITPEATIYTDWAKSAHAGGILQAKYDAVDAYPKKADGTYNRSAGMTDAVMAVGATDATGIGWTYYNWDNSTGNPSTHADPDRKSCQRCHTATGAANFMSNPAGYNPVNNSFTHLEGWTVNKTSPQQEVLYCWGCHSNAGTGELRTPGTPTFTYTNGATASYPDVAGSNVCMTCHTGRETGDSIKNDADADGVRSFINSHYLSAGGQLFGKTGYEFAGVSYDNPSYFEHDQIGSAAAPGTGSNGPCVGCHMTTANTHSFKVVTKDGTGTITAINSTACATCHTGAYALTPASLTAEEEDYVAALEALKAALASKGIHFFNAHPYFYQAAGGAGGAFTNWAGVYGFASWKDVMGAAFNANLLLHDPGGYAHNRIYSKRLIWDSIDFITDGTLGNVNMATTIDGFGLDAATTAAAKAYLGTTRP